MNLEAPSYNLSSVKNELRLPLEDINPYALVYLFERCKRNGSLDDAIRVSSRQDRIWGYNKMNSTNNNQNNNSPGVQRTPENQDNDSHNPENVHRQSRHEERPELNVSQQSAWNRLRDSPAVCRPTDDNWLLPEDLEDRFVDVMNLIGDQEKYAQHEYVREWLSKRQSRSVLSREPILSHIHRMDPPGFILTTQEFPDEKLLVDLLRQFRHPYLAYRKKTICIFADSSQIDSLVHRLHSKKISAVVLSETVQDNKGSNSVFLTAHVRNVGLPVDNLINYQMFRSANQYVDRMRLLRRRGHMTTFFNPSSDSKFVPNLVQEMRKRNIEVPAFLKHRSGENTEYLRR